MPVTYSEHSEGPSTRRNKLWYYAGPRDPSWQNNISYEGMTKAELQEELEQRGLPKTGNKADLIERLQASD